MKGRILKYLILVILAGTVRVGFSAAVFSDQAVLSDNEVSAGCWAKPTTPTLVSPADGYMAVPGSGWLANPVMDWTDSYTTCPSGVIQYRYESYHDAGLTSLAYHSSLLSASQIPAPGTSDGDYYWRVAAFDGTTWSDWSEVWKLTVDRSYQTVGAGDVVINEVMWMGSAPVEEDSNRSDDEWIELRNMTDYEIDIGQWEIENARSSGQPSLMIPASKAIAANGYFLIANYSENSANSALNVSVDEVNASISLANSGNGHLVLKDAAGNTIDEAKGNTWPAGESGTQKKSMERNGVPGDGLDAGSWHTCTDAVCNDGTYWDVEGDNYGTPGGENHSENDPTAVGEKQAGEALETAQATVEPFIEDGQAGGESGGATEEGSSDEPAGESSGGDEGQVDGEEQTVDGVVDEGVVGEGQADGDVPEGDGGADGLDGEDAILEEETVEPEEEGSGEEVGGDEGTDSEVSGGDEGGETDGGEDSDDVLVGE